MTGCELVVRTHLLFPRPGTALLGGLTRHHAAWADRLVVLKVPATNLVAAVVTLGRPSRHLPLRYPVADWFPRDGHAARWALLVPIVTFTMLAVLVEAVHAEQVGVAALKDLRTWQL